MAQLQKLLVLVAVLVVSVSCLTISGQTHHVVGGDAVWSDSSSGRVFRVGDKISFIYPATEETIVELHSLEDFTSCNLVNPIRMYTDSDRHITLEKEGIRYFTSADPDNCKNGLKIPVSVQPISPNDAGYSFNHPFAFPSPFEPEPGHSPPSEQGPPPFEPWPKPFPESPPPPSEPWPKPFSDSPPPPVSHSPPPPVPHLPPLSPSSPPPEPHFPPPSPSPPPPVPHFPPPSPSPPPPVPHFPPPSPSPLPPVPHFPPPPPPIAPSASTRINGFSLALFAALALCYTGHM